MTTYLTRMEEELIELVTKILKLETFILSSPKFLALPREDRGLLKEQLNYMHGYHRVLSTRLKKAKEVI